MTKVPPPAERLRSVFRSFLIAEICIFVLFVPVSVMEVLVLESSLKGVPQTGTFPVAETVVAGFACLLFVILIPAIIVAWVGLFQTRSWARWLYFRVHAVGYSVMIASSLFNWSYQWGFTNSLGSVGSVITGCILSLLFYSDLARDFEVQTDTFQLPK